MAHLRLIFAANYEHGRPIMQAGLIIIGIFVIILAACILPWWWLPLMIGGGILWNIINPRKF